MSERAPVVIVVSAPSEPARPRVVARVLSEVPGLRFSVSHTTRPPRGDEREGVDYHFVDRAELRAACATRASCSSGPRCTAISTAPGAPSSSGRGPRACDVLLDLDVQGAAQVREP